MKKWSDWTIASPAPSGPVGVPSFKMIFSFLCFTLKISHQVCRCHNRKMTTISEVHLDLDLHTDL